ncbi:MAG: AhpC/TSA family protein [Bacteroidota bacterium]|nr:AhpC/TSA family protein [Bacteroidota bacterium]
MKKITTPFAIRQLISLLSLCILFSCSKHHFPPAPFLAGEPYMLNGQITGLDSGRIYLVRDDTTHQSPYSRLDSAEVRSGHFVFNGRVKKAEPCKIEVPHSERLWPYSGYFILDSGHTKAMLYYDSMPSSVFTGSVLQDQLVQVDKKLFLLNIHYQRLLVTTKNEDSANLIDKEWQSNQAAFILEQIKAYPNSIVSAFIIKKRLLPGLPLNTMEDIYDNLQERDNYYARDYLKEIQAKKRSVTGANAPRFVLYDTEGHKLTNDTFKGKYLLLDFWATWCAPCLEEIPNISKAYENFSEKGLQMVSVSLDNDQQAFRNALEQYKCPWTQVCDFKGWHNKLFENYSVEFIPNNFLIDPAGKIIDQNLTGERLQAVLHDIF